MSKHCRKYKYSTRWSVGNCLIIAKKCWWLRWLTVTHAIFHISKLWRYKCENQQWWPLLTRSHWMLLNHRQIRYVNNLGSLLYHQCRASLGTQTEKRRRSIKWGKIITNWTVQETTMSIKECTLVKLVVITAVKT